jgi:hypothetical protein
LVSVKPLVTLWPSRFLLTTWRRLFTTPTSILLVTYLVGSYGWAPLMMNPLSCYQQVLPQSFCLSISCRGLYGFYNCRGWDWQWLPSHVHCLCKWFGRLHISYGPKRRWAASSCLYHGVYSRPWTWSKIVWWPPYVQDLHQWW